MYAFRVFFVFIYECKNNKIYPMWAMFYQCMAPNSQNFHFLEPFIGHLILITIFEFFIY